MMVTEYVADLSDGGLSKLGGEPLGFGSKGILERSASAGISTAITTWETRATHRCLCDENPKENNIAKFRLKF